MNARKFLLGLVASVMSLSVAPVMAAELEASAGVDFVSSYVWRGQYQGQGAAIQPSAGISVGGFSVSAWGSTSLDATSGKELDFTVGYEIGGFSIAATDYWWNGEYNDAGASAQYFEPNSHYQEVALGYTFGEDFPLSLSVATMVHGDDDMYSTYIQASYPFSISAVDCTATIGATPAEGMYSGLADDGLAANKAGITSVGLNFSYDLLGGKSKFSLPVFVDVSVSPIQEDAYIVAGFSFSL